MQGLQERLMVLFPQDVLLLSVDNRQLNIRYEVLEQRLVQRYFRNPPKREKYYSNNTERKQINKHITILTLFLDSLKQSWVE